MNMTVDEVFGLEGPHEPEEGAKTTMTGVFLVVYPFGGRMGQEYVQIPSPENPVKNQGGYELPDFHLHLKIGVLVFSPVIPHGAPQTGDDETLFPPYL
jgi:hypothetical protein